MYGNPGLRGEGQTEGGGDGQLTDQRNIQYSTIKGLTELLPCHVWQPWTPRRRTDRRRRRWTINGLTEHILTLPCVATLDSEEKDRQEEKEEELEVNARVHWEVDQLFLEGQ